MSTISLCFSSRQPRRRVTCGWRRRVRRLVSLGGDQSVPHRMSSPKKQHRLKSAEFDKRWHGTYLATIGRYTAKIPCRHMMPPVNTPYECKNPQTWTTRGLTVQYTRVAGKIRLPDSNTTWISYSASILVLILKLTGQARRIPRSSPRCPSHPSSSPPTPARSHRGLREGQV